jgi:DNA-directed RNA polymerase specialized sigma subunit
VREAIASLPERQRRIIELRFGIGGEPKALEAIGKELGITRSACASSRPRRSPGSRTSWPKRPR